MANPFADWLCSKMAKKKALLGTSPAPCCTESAEREKEVAVEAIVGQCEDCAGTGWYGDNGPGILCNSEFHRCDCGTVERCSFGWHKYIEHGGVPWCEECNREADLDICRLHHPLPNAANEPRSFSK